MNFANVKRVLKSLSFRKIPESCGMTHAPKSLKSLLEKVSGKSSESFPENLPILVNPPFGSVVCNQFF